MEFPHLVEGTQSDPNHIEPPQGVRYQINEHGDTEIQLECIIEEDILEELEEFMCLARQGLFTRALDLFDQTLEESLDKFPVIIEYAECLYDQGRKDHLSELLDQRKDAPFQKEEKNLLELLDALVRVPNEQEKSLATARHCTDMRFSSRSQFTDIEVFVTIKIYQGNKMILINIDTDKRNVSWDYSTCL